MPDFSASALTLAQAHGIGGVEANLVLMGWSRTPPGRTGAIKLMRGLVALGKSVLFLHYDPERGYGQRQVINVWWQGRGGNADLKLLLAHLIQRHGDWRGSRVQLLRIVESPKAVDQTYAHLRELLAAVRVEAEPVVVVHEEASQSIVDVIRLHSQSADLNIMGMHVPEADEVEAYGARLDELAQAVGSVLFVRNARQDEELLQASG